MLHHLSNHTISGIKSIYRMSYIPSCRVILYHVTACILSCQVIITCHIIYPIMSCHIMYHVMSHHVSYHVISCILSCHVISHIISCHMTYHIIYHIIKSGSVFRPVTWSSLDHSCTRNQN